MSMTTSQVLEMAKKLHESEDEVIIPETESKEEMQPENNVETNDTIPENEVVSDEAVGNNQETIAESEEKEKSNQTDKSNKQVPTKEEKEKHAFTKLKNKEKQKREKLINDYEMRLKSLSEELEKFKGLQKSNFNNDEEYMNYLVDQKLKERETNEIMKAKASAEAEAFEEINQQRIANCFPDEKEREIYNKLISTSAPQFVNLLEKADPDNAVLSYLDDSDIAPILIRVLMTKPDIRNEILTKRNPYSKVLALDNLAKRITYAKGIVDKKRQQPQQKQKPTIPVVGRVAKSDASAPQLDRNDPNYYNNLLHELNSRRR